MRKKRSTGKVLLIGAAALAAGYGIYEFFIKPRQNAGAGNSGNLPPGFEPGSSAALPPGTNLIDAANSAPVNEIPQLSPIGTPDNKLKYDLLIKKGDKGGEVVKLQKISNVVSKIYKTPLLKTDGVFGNLTNDKISRQFGRTEITLNRALQFMRAIEAWNKNNRVGKWSDYIA